MSKLRHVLYELALIAVVLVIVGVVGVVAYELVVNWPQGQSGCGASQYGGVGSC